MAQLSAIVRKELKLLFRDIHGLALLFVMPVIFILIMSLAMKQDFDRRSGVAFEVLVIDQIKSPASAELLASVAGRPQFTLVDFTTQDLGSSESSLSLAEKAVATDRYSFLLNIPEGAFTVSEQLVSKVLVAPGVVPEIAQLFVATLKQAVAQQKVLLMLQELEHLGLDPEMLDVVSADGAAIDKLVSVQYGFQSGSSDEAPTSVQQNVPAWLVFSMFFVVVPLANTLINERQLGTLRRIQTIAVPRWKLIAGKIIPYYFINQIQVVLMLLVGVFVVPALGGDRLTLGDSFAGLVLISCSLSVAALGYAILVAVICRSTEQATTLGGAGNIILAALGGIMVPTFIMPEFMRMVTVVSPMSWGLQGFLDLFSRGAGVLEILPEAASLVLLGICSLLLALFFMSRQTD